MTATGIANDCPQLAELRRFRVRLKRPADSRLFPEADRSSSILAGIKYYL